MRLKPFLATLKMRWCIIVYKKVIIIWWLICGDEDIIFVQEVNLNPEEEKLKNIIN